MAKPGTVSIRGKEYKTVALRVAEFREQCPAQDGWAIVTDLVERTEQYVIVRAHILKEGVTLATGLAEEMRASSQINKTSALENCETSAIGRALAAFGLGGSEYASANEVVNAVHQQKTSKLTAKQQAKVDDALADIASCQSVDKIEALGVTFKEKSEAFVQDAVRETWGARKAVLKQLSETGDSPL